MTLKKKPAAAAQETNEPEKRKRPATSAGTKVNTAISGITLFVIVGFYNKTDNWVEKLAHVETRMDNIEFNLKKDISDFQGRQNNYLLDLHDTKSTVEELKLQAAKVEGLLTNKDQFKIRK